MQSKLPKGKEEKLLPATEMRRRECEEKKERRNSALHQKKEKRREKGGLCGSEKGKIFIKLTEFSGVETPFDIY